MLIFDFIIWLNYNSKTPTITNEYLLQVVKYRQEPVDLIAIQGYSLIRTMYNFDREEQLLPILLGNKYKFGIDLSDTQELSSGYGIADLVFYSLDQEIVNQRKLKKINPIDSIDMVRILTKLNGIKCEKISLTILSEVIPDLKHNQRLMSYLIENGFLIPNNGDLTDFRKGSDYRVGLKEVVAIEAKLSNWKRGLYQAYRYKEYANQSYLALYSKYIHRALLNKNEFIRFNVGLIEVADSDIKIHIKPKSELIRQNVYSALVFERLLGTQKNFFPNL